MEQKLYKVTIKTVQTSIIVVAGIDKKDVQNYINETTEWQEDICDEYSETTHSIQEIKPIKDIKTLPNGHDGNTCPWNTWYTFISDYFKDIKHD